MSQSADILSTLRSGVLSTSVEQTEALAAALAAVLPAEAVLALHGDLGSGKTSFVRGLARAWGIEGPITSPSFNLLNLYRAPRRTLVHIDAYRLQSDEQAEGLLLDDFLEPPYCLAVEWPEQFPAYRLYSAFHIEFAILPASSNHFLKLRSSAGA